MKDSKQKGAGAILAIVVILVIVVVAFLIFGNRKDTGVSEELPVDQYPSSEENIESAMEEEVTGTELDDIGGITDSEDVTELEDELEDFDLSDLDIDFEL